MVLGSQVAGVGKPARAITWENSCLNRQARSADDDGAQWTSSPSRSAASAMAKATRSDVGATRSKCPLLMESTSQSTNLSLSSGSGELRTSETKREYRPAASRWSV